MEEGAYLEVTKLREHLTTLLQLALVWLELGVDDFVGADVTALGEGLTTDFAGVWTLAGVAALVGLYT